MSMSMFMPTVEPTINPTMVPTLGPTVERSREPTIEPNMEPTMMPNMQPIVSAIPSMERSVEPSIERSVEPSTEISVEPSMERSVQPSTKPTVDPRTVNCTDPTTRAALITDEITKISGQSALNDPTSPQSFALEWLIENDPLQINPCDVPTINQRYALAVLFYATNGNDWINNAGWLSGSGTIPPEISQLQQARVITIVRNKVTGTLPTEIGTLPGDRLSDLSNLRQLDFGDN
eukprot:1525798-Ditylum_brightwellii.AAC.1